MTSRSDQLTKLLGKVKEFPLTLVSDTVKNINAAITRLSDTDIEKLEKVNMIPNCEDGSYTICSSQRANGSYS